MQAFGRETGRKQPRKGLVLFGRIRIGVTEGTRFIWEDKNRRDGRDSVYLGG